MVVVKAKNMNPVITGFSPLTPITSVKNKLDPSDTELKTLIDNNQSWAEAVSKAEPTYFKEMALKQEPKILWIGKNYNLFYANSSRLVGTLFIYHLHVGG